MENSPLSYKFGNALLYSPIEAITAHYNKDSRKDLELRNLYNIFSSDVDLY